MCNELVRAPVLDALDGDRRADFIQSRWTELDLSGANLVALPERIGTCAALQTLDLYHCQTLTALPDSVGELKVLKKLNLGSCEKLKSLPESISGCTALQILKLNSCCSLKSLPE